MNKYKSLLKPEGLQEKLHLLWSVYKDLLINITDDDDIFKSILKLIEFLTAYDFQNQPASTNWHYPIPGGLLVHSLNVYVQLKRLCELYKIEYDEDEIVIIGLLHDLCKIDSFIYSTKEKRYLNNPKNILPVGHGDKSVMILQNYINLTNNEILAIKWHMGVFSLDKSNKMMQHNFDLAFDNPIVLLTHLADWTSARIIEKDFEKNVNNLIEELVEFL